MPTPEHHTGALTVREHRDHTIFSSLKADWTLLQARCERATPYQSWEWLSAWWRLYGARKRPRVVAVYAGARLVALAPLYISHHLNTPVRRLAWMGTGHSDYLGMLCCTGFEDRAAAAVLGYLHSSMAGWDMADLQQLRPESALAAHAAACPLVGSDRSILLKSDLCPVVSLPGTWDAYASRLGKSLRSNLRYYRKQLEKDFGSVQFRIADATTLPADITALFDLHQKRWNARWLPGVLGTKRVQEFHRLAAENFLQQGWLRLHLLDVGGMTCAALYCFASGGTTYYYLGGFSPELSRYSPGTLLTARAISVAIEDGCTEFDFLRGSESYKYRWMPEERLNQRLLLLRRRDGIARIRELSGRAGFAMSHVERYVVGRARSLADHGGHGDEAHRRGVRHEPAARRAEITSALGKD